MGARFVVTALIAVMVLSLMVSMKSHKRRLPRIGKKSYTFGDWNARQGLSTGYRGTGGNGRSTVYKGTDGNGRQ
uniref:Conotoxin unclassified superfamily n=3 Tax=Conus TaxID=6490 RepID=A0A9Y2E3Z5_CONFG|nr:conotoxin precursor unclassified superfamily [Conus frigidus]WIU44168.1 conotoxin precursor unclassified superfamily [Conus miles]WIU44169.1 conotoxin precursor unclassified superfamily [Conus litteratus]